MTDRECAHCGKPLVRRKDESASHFARRNNCDAACGRAKAAANLNVSALFVGKREQTRRANELNAYWRAKGIEANARTEYLDGCWQIRSDLGRLAMEGKLR